MVSPGRDGDKDVLPQSTGSALASFRAAPVRHHGWGKDATFQSTGPLSDLFGLHGAKTLHTPVDGLRARLFPGCARPSPGVGMLAGPRPRWHPPSAMVIRDAGIEAIRPPRGGSRLMAPESKNRASGELRGPGGMRPPPTGANAVAPPPSSVRPRVDRRRRGPTPTARGGCGCGRTGSGA